MFNKLKNNFKVVATRFWKDESAQGATEYILLLVVVVAIATMFRGHFEGSIQGLVTSTVGKIQDFIQQ